MKRILPRSARMLLLLLAPSLLCLNSAQAALSCAGSLDATFNAGGQTWWGIWPPWAPTPISTVTVQHDGKVVISGDFYEVQGVAITNGIARLNADGVIDTNYTANPADVVSHTRATQSDGKILRLGALDEESLTTVIRVNPDGTPDPGFVAALPSGFIPRVIALQPDGRVLVAGGVSERSPFWNILTVNQPVVRLNSDGSLDTSFTSHLLLDLRPFEWSADATIAVYDMVLQADGRIYIGGFFTTVNGVPRTDLARLNPDGSLDMDFEPDITVYPGWDGSDVQTISAMGLAPDGKLVIAGMLTEINGVIRHAVARLHTAGGGCPGVIAFAAAEQVVNETNGTVLVTVQRAGNTNRAVSVNYSTADVDAMSGQDYMARQGTLSFAAGQLAQTFSIPILDDQLREANEHFNVFLSDPADGAVLATPDRLQVVILDDENLGRPGSVDDEFRPALNGKVVAAVVQADGRIVIAGEFTEVNGVPRGGLARLNRNGTLDPAFDPHMDGPVLTVTLVPGTQQFFVAGSFTHVNGHSHTCLARFNRDGSLDSAFAPVIDGAVSRIALQNDGRILTAGSFTSVEDTPRVGLARIDPNGSLDTSFTPSSSQAAAAYGLVALDGGKVLLGTRASPTPVRFDAGGALEQSFHLDGLLEFVFGQDLLVQPDGKILFACYSQTLSGSKWEGLIRFNPDGSRDSSFAVREMWVDRVALQPDGKILVNGLIRLNPDGSPDPGFFTGSGVNREPVEVVTLQPDGDVLVGGAFSHVNGLRHPYLARLHGNPPPPPLTDQPEALDATNLAWTSGGTLGGAGAWFSQTAVTHDGRDAAQSGAVGDFQESWIQTTVTVAVPSYLHFWWKVSCGFGDFGLAFYTNGIIAGGNIEGEVGWEFRTVRLSPGTHTLRWTFSNAAGGDEGATAGWVDEVSIEPVESGVYCAGDVVSGFLQTSPGLQDGVGAVLVLPHGKILAGGNGIIRLNPDGTQDDTFHCDLSGHVSAMAFGSNGTIIVAGDLSLPMHEPFSVARVYPNGAVDDEFFPTANGPVTALAVQSDGRILVGGRFTEMDGVPRVNVARLNANGSIDTGFDPGTVLDVAVNALLVQAHGRILVGGDFWIHTGSPSVRTGLARLQPDGTLDPTFDLQLDGGVNALAAQADGRVLVGGMFHAAQDRRASGLLRINADGTLDSSFLAGSGSTNAGFYVVFAVAVQPTGDIVVGGYRWVPDESGVPDIPLAHLSADGVPDPVFETFLTVTDPEQEAFSVNALAFTAGGDVIAAGAFAYVNGIPRRNLAVIHAHGQHCPGFVAFGSGSATVNENAGHVLIPLVRQGGSSGALSVDFATVDGEALAGQDFLARAGTLTFADGEMAKTIEVSVIDDSEMEANELFSLSLTAPPATRIFRLGSTLSRDVLILDDDKIGQPGTVDSGFAGAVYGRVSAMARGPGDKIVIAGYFTLGGVNLPIARLNGDGTRDITFTPPAIDSFVVDGLAVQPDGKIILGGLFDSVQGVPRHGIARLNVDGSLDSTFDPGAGLAEEDWGNGQYRVFQIIVRADGKVLIAGSFTRVNGTRANSIALLNADGSLDTAFNAHLLWSGRSPWLNSMVVQPDGKIVVGGLISSADGVAVTHLTRLNADGTRDTSFSATAALGAASSARAIALQADGKLIVGGEFLWQPDGPSTYLLRLSTDGSRDETFAPSASAWPTSIAIQADGRIITVSATGVARLNPDGSRDAAFFTAGEFRPGADARCLLLEDGRLLVCGEFATVDHLPYSGIVMLLLDQPPHIVALPSMGHAAGFRMQLDVAPGTSVNLESSTNFVDWEYVGTYYRGLHDEPPVCDANTASHPARYFRLRRY